MGIVLSRSLLSTVQLQQTKYTHSLISGHEIFLLPKKPFSAPNKIYSYSKHIHFLRTCVTYYYLAHCFLSLKFPCSYVLPSSYVMVFVSGTSSRETFLAHSGNSTQIYGTNTSSSRTILRPQVSMASLWVFFEMVIQGNPFCSPCTQLCNNLCAVIQQKSQRRVGKQRNLFFRKCTTNVDNYPNHRLHWKTGDCTGELIHLKTVGWGAKNSQLKTCRCCKNVNMSLIVLTLLYGFC